MGEGEKKKPHVNVEILQVAQNYVSKRDTSQSDQLNPKA